MQSEKEQQNAVGIQWEAAIKIVSYTALLYGSDFLGWAIRSVIDHVDEHHIIYSPIGAHGYRTDLPCPDTRDELYEIAKKAAGSKLVWHDAGPFTQENQQRESIYQYAPDADVILVVDADEIWSEAAIELGLLAGRYAQCRYWRMPMIHFWRSFWKAVIHDPAYPARIICPGVRSGESTLDWSSVNSMPTGYLGIAHMGYAQRPAIVEYKQYTHGHRGEWRRDVDWYRDRFLNKEATSDLHPVGSEYWAYEKINPLDYMPSWMALHPFFSLDWIE